MVSRKKFWVSLRKFLNGDSGVVRASGPSLIFLVCERVRARMSDWRLSAWDQYLANWALLWCDKCGFCSISNYAYQILLYLLFLMIIFQKFTPPFFSRKPHQTHHLRPQHPNHHPLHHRCLRNRRRHRQHHGRPHLRIRPRKNAKSNQRNRPLFRKL